MVGEEVTSTEELRREVDVTIVLEEAIIDQSEGVIEPSQDCFLVFDVINVLAINDFFLLHRLDGVLLAWVGG